MHFLRLAQKTELWEDNRLANSRHNIAHVAEKKEKNH